MSLPEGREHAQCALLVVPAKAPVTKLGDRLVVAGVNDRFLRDLADARLEQLLREAEGERLYRLVRRCRRNRGAAGPVEVTPDSDGQRGSRAGRRRTRRIALVLLVRAFPGWFASIVGLALLNGALPALFAVLVGRLVAALPGAVEAGFGSDAGRDVLRIVAGLGIVLALQEVPAAAWVLWEDLLNRYDGYIRSRIMAAALSVPGLELFEDPALAAQTDRTVRFVGRYPGEIVCGYAEKWSAQAQGLAAAVVVATVWPLAAAPLALLWFLAGRQLQVDYARTEGTWAERRRRAYYLKEVGVGSAWAKEVRIFGLVGWLADRFGREWGRYLSQLRHARRRETRTLAPLFGLIIAANAGVLWLAVRSALTGDLGVGALTVLVQGLFAMPFLANQDSDHLVEMGSIPTAELVRLEELVVGIPAPTGQLAVADRPRHEIRFEGVGFAYPASDAAVFDRLDLSIEAGRSLGVVGLNGAGKTTLIKLLTGLERPQHGMIKVDGTDLDDLDPTSWHQCIAAIFQDFVRYEMSARDNIGFGAISRTDKVINIDDDMIMTAARNAGADALIRDLPDGLSTVLSRRFTGGVDLSGGQWQRIALARAMAAVQAGARVLVLDEPTAHLDARAEADIYDRFLDLTSGLTTIVISHRFSTVRRADRIVVLDSGRITEDGTHDELVAADGVYARLFRTQAGRYTGATHA